MSHSSGSISGDDYSHFSEFSDEGRSVSTLADLLERFTIGAQPDCTLKLRSALGPVVVGADITRVLAAKANTAALVIKPSGGDPVWRRLRVDNSGMLTLRSRKLSWWLFTLDLTAHANPLTRSFDFSYRLATKWDIPRGEYRNKRRFELGAKTEARAHWSISYSLPAIEGSMGTSAQRVNQEVHADVGYAHLDIPRLELVVWPRGRPGEAPTSSGSAAALDDKEESNAMAGDSGTDVPAVAAAAGGSSSSAGGGDGVVHAQDHHLPEYLRGEGSGGTAAAGSGSGSARRRKASLPQLSSHVASLSGRWWETFGGDQRR